MKIDCIINVYGKPWQTLCTLKSLLKYSGQWIDRIYFIEEREQPYGDDVRWVSDEFNSLDHYIPRGYKFISHSFDDPRDLIRYQYGIDHSDKKYVFITHNDILYTGDIIGAMLSSIGYKLGIGRVGACWNCPAGYADLCDGYRIDNFFPSYKEVLELCNKFPPARDVVFRERIHPVSPKPLPECRLNEFACIIDREITNMEDGPLFGDFGLDTGMDWFRSMYLKGYRFQNFDIDKYSVHGYWTPLHKEKGRITTGYPVQCNEKLYREAEENAKQFYSENYAG